MSDGSDRFVSAQGAIYENALAEMRAGQKRTHWMWFIFPQLAGLGRSETAQFYAIKNLPEAQAYLAHAILGTRLRECAQAMLAHGDRSAHDILGSPDDLKLKSSMTLFEQAAPDEASNFTEVLERFYQGDRCALTLHQLAIE